MAKKLKVGDTLHGYRITKVFGPGMMAISYAAHSSTGQKVFFKQYKSPAPTVVWYGAFVAYQKELSARVKSGAAAHFAVRQLDAFEAQWGGRCYFQAYEFVENGSDLQQLLDAERERHRRTGAAPARDSALWARHVTWARVLVAAVAALHEVRVMHADLKPANAYLIADSTLGSGAQLKLIDMDFSLLADRRAPWHGFQGYVGSDNYRSPEHLVRGEMPAPASDVFTCALMLYELLAGEHPYWRDDQGEYARLVQAHAAKPPPLLGLLPAPASNAEVSAALHRCLSPNAAARPTAAELRETLSGRGAKAELPKAARSAAPVTTVTPAVSPGPAQPAPASARPTPGASSSVSSAAPGSSTSSVAPGVRAAPAAPRPAGAPVAATPARARGQKIDSERLELVSPDGRSIQLGVRTELGKALVRQFGPDGDYWDQRQCVLERNAGQEWVVSPVPGTANETLVNGQALTAPRVLEQGDLIAVGRQAKGIIKLPLTARGR